MNTNSVSPRDESDLRANPVRQFAEPLFILGAVFVGELLGVRRFWMCDDAFISFRYAENLVNGLGLVYNAGERVEGYTNFLWTLWIALGLRLGLEAEAWAGFWGLVCYGATIALLWRFHRRLRRGCGATGFSVPVAALVAVAHTEWNNYATGGLETSLFTLLATGGYVLLVGSSGGWQRPVAAGAVLGLASLTRPDGVIFAALGGMYLLWVGRPRVRAVLMYSALLLLIWAPHLVWRVWYYGDFYPNSYYAKSAYQAWYSQGWTYVWLYFEKYWVLLLGFPLLAGFLAARKGRFDGGEGEAVAPVACWGILAAAFALGYTCYILRVGGGFMYGRLLIPATPFYAILLEIGLTGLARGRVKVLQPVVGVMAVAAMIVTPGPLPDRADIRGIVNEWLFYPASETEQARRDGETLQRYFEGLPVRVAFFGGEARMIYYSKVHTAIECDAGLTDRFIARQPLSHRGRVGHEKKPTADYLIEKRKVHLIFHALLEGYLGLDELIPVGGVAFNNVRARLLHWDPEVMAGLRARGAEFEDFTEYLDRVVIPSLPDMSDEQVGQMYRKCRWFYFDHVEDPARERPFVTRRVVPDRDIHPHGG